jgi:hypothetical protein
MNSKQSSEQIPGGDGYFVTQVYRYHLARRGNFRDAEQLTRATFQSFKPAGGPWRGKEPALQLADARVNLFRSALRQQASLRHDSSGASLTEGDPNETQGELFVRARLAALADYWASLPGWQADALALASFGELDGRSISRVMRRGGAEIETLLAGQADMLQELGGLAGQVALPADFAVEIQAELDQMPTRASRPTLFSAGGLLDRVELPGWLSNQAARRVSQVAMGAMAVLALSFGLWTSIHASANTPRVNKYTQAPPTESVGSAAGSAANPAGGGNGNTGLAVYQPDPGLLVPPDQATCLKWQSDLTDLFHTSAPLGMVDNAPFDDPSTAGAEGVGYGCFVNFRPNGPATNLSLSRVQSFLTSQGYTRIGGVDTGCPTPPVSSSLYNFTNNCASTSSTTWVKKNQDTTQRVIVEMTGQEPFGGIPFGGGFFDGEPNGLSAPATTPVWSTQPKEGGPQNTSVPQNAGDPQSGSAQPNAYGPSGATATPTVDTAKSPFGTPAGPSLAASAPDPTATPENPWASQCLRYYTDGPCNPPSQAFQRRGITLRVGIATDAVKPVIDAFLNQWAFDQSTVTNLLAARLRASLPDVNAMDQAANIIRRPDLGVKITWQTVENTGREVRLQITVDQASALALPSQQSGPFLVVFSWVDQKWQVSALGPLSAPPAAN